MQVKRFIVSEINSLRPMPTKLEREPLIDAVFEMRFEASAPVSSILPGLLYSSLDGEKTIDNTPAMSLPKEFRDREPNLAYAPLVRIGWGDFWIFVGDKVFSVSSKLPYPGWTKLREAIFEAYKLICHSGLINGVSRYSIKYVDLISDQSGIALEDIFDFDLRVGGQSAGSKDYQVRADIIDGATTHVVSIISTASSHVIGEAVARTGSVVDIDSYVDLGLEPPEVFYEALPGRVELIHAANKRLFFNCLSERTLEWLGPVYE